MWNIKTRDWKRERKIRDIEVNLKCLSKVQLIVIPGIND